MRTYLNDKDFLKEIDNLPSRKQYMKIILLDFVTEVPKREIQSVVIDGNITLDGQSNIRRICNLDVYIDQMTNQITNADNLFSISTKLKLEMGIENTTARYLEEDIIWFPLGTFVICEANINDNAAGGLSASFSLKDKMCLLNGEMGGVLPAAITFSEMDDIDEEGNTITKRPCLYQIITETVNHWGGEQLGKIIIRDVDEKIKRVIKTTKEIKSFYDYNNKVNNNLYDNEYLVNHIESLKNGIRTLGEVGSSTFLRETWYKARDQIANTFISEAGNKMVSALKNNFFDKAFVYSTDKAKEGVQLKVEEEEYEEEDILALSFCVDWSSSSTPFSINLNTALKRLSLFKNAVIQFAQLRQQNAAGDWSDDSIYNEFILGGTQNLSAQYIPRLLQEESKKWERFFKDTKETSDQYDLYNIILLQMGIGSHSNKERIKEYLCLNSNNKDWVNNIKKKLVNYIDRKIGVRIKSFYDSNGKFDSRFPLADIFNIEQAIGDSYQKYLREGVEKAFRETFFPFVYKTIVDSFETYFNSSIEDVEAKVQSYLTIIYNDKETYPDNVLHRFQIEKDKDIGFEYVDFTYNGDLTTNPGDNICTVLDAIKNMLGNYEYFYDVNGNFIFQEIRNNLNTTEATTLLNLKTDHLFFNKDNIYYYFNESSLVESYSNVPQYPLIKNDYIIWGEMESATGQKLPIRYHLAIDDKPNIKKFFIEDKELFLETEDSIYGEAATGVPNYNFHNWKQCLNEKSEMFTSNLDFPFPEDNQKPVTNGVYVLKNMDCVVDYTKATKQEKQKISKYFNLLGKDIAYDINKPVYFRWDNNAQRYLWYKSGIFITLTSNIEHNPVTEQKNFLLLQQDTEDWRSVVFFNTFFKDDLLTNSSSYETELVSEWGRIYSIVPQNLNSEETYQYYEIKINDYYIRRPNAIKYFLDIIEGNQNIQDISISKIGRRTEVLNDETINCIFEPEIPETIYYKEGDESPPENAIMISEKFYDEYMSGGGYYNSAALAARDLLVQHTRYNSSISLSCIPIYYLEPNTKIRVDHDESNIHGEYLINSITLPLNANGTMTINASENIIKI